MKTFILAFIILLTANAGFGQRSEGGSQPKYATDDEVPRISVTDAKKALDDASAIFVDARSPTAYRDNHIKGAINIPIGSTDNYDSLPKGKKIIVYCS